MPKKKYNQYHKWKPTKRDRRRAYSSYGAVRREFDENRCMATSAETGERCCNKAMVGGYYCFVHRRT